MLQPASVIDIGIGHGKTGVLLREYLDVMQERYRREEWVTKLFGIEAFAGYHNPLWDYVYDSVQIGDALSVLDQLPDVNLIIALDVWEHFSKDYALSMLEVCLHKADFLLISTPKAPLSQGSVFGNSYEQHISKWAPRDFKYVPHRLFGGTSKDWIILLSSNKQFPLLIRRLGNPMSLLFEDLGIVVSLWKEILFSRIK